MSDQLDSAALACDLTVLDPHERDKHERLATRLFTEVVQERTDLTQGYAFRFPADQYLVVAMFIANERRCCPFFTFTLEVMADQGAVWLRITGPEGAKAILQSALSD